MEYNFKIRPEEKEIDYEKIKSYWNLNMVDINWNKKSIYTDSKKKVIWTEGAFKIKKGIVNLVESWKGIKRIVLLIFNSIFLKLI